MEWEITVKTLICKNPKCRREFTPDSAHRCLPYCCAMCQRECTPNVTRQRSRGGDVGISVDLGAPAIQRVHGRDNRE